MKIFFDCEFTGLHQNTTLISIGLTTKNGYSFYAEFTDYNKEDVDDWIQENVIANLSKDMDDLKNFADVNIKGTKFEVMHALIGWLEGFESTIEFVSDVCHYDFVLLIGLIAGNAMSLPSYMSPVCHDINSDIAKRFSISESEAFDMSREDILKVFGTEVEGKKHNSIYDAKVIAKVYEKVRERIEFCD